MQALKSIEFSLASGTEETEKKSRGFKHDENGYTVAGLKMVGTTCKEQRERESLETE